MLVVRRSQCGRTALRLLWAGLGLLVLAGGLIVLGACGVFPQLTFGRTLGGMGGVGLLMLLIAVSALVCTFVSRDRVVRRALASLAIAVGGVALIALFPPRWPLALVNDPAGPLFYVETDAPLAALTIDDGVSPQTTPSILDVLRRHDARATFFVVSETIGANGDLVERLLAEGHELASHQATFAPAIGLTRDELAAEVSRADKALRAIAPVRWFRPAGGYVSESVIDAARAHGCTVALGSVFPFDSHAPWAPFIAAYVAHRTLRGDVIVLHDGPGRGRRTAAALDAALPRLADRGLRCVTLSELADGAP